MVSETVLVWITYEAAWFEFDSSSRVDFNLCMPYLRGLKYIYILRTVVSWEHVLRTATMRSILGHNLTLVLTYEPYSCYHI